MTDDPIEPADIERSRAGHQWAIAYVTALLASETQTAVALVGEALAEDTGQALLSLGTLVQGMTRALAETVGIEPLAFLQSVAPKMLRGIDDFWGP